MREEGNHYSRANAIEIKENCNAENEGAQGRQKTIQDHRLGKDQTLQSVQEPHPDEEDVEEKTSPPSAI
jgi:hypothetical protein